MVQDVQSAETFKLNKVIMRADRFSKDLILYTQNSGSGVVEFNLYEHIDTPFITGDIIYQDDNDLYQVADLQGTEQIEIEYESPGSQGAPVVINATIVDVEYNVKSNDFTSLLKINFIESHGWYGKIGQTSHTYEGTSEQILKNIVEAQLGVPFTNRAIQSQQTQYRYLQPYITAFKAIDAVQQKMTTPNGLPYFCYSGIGQDGLTLKDMETMLQEIPFNRGKPFTYSQAVTNDPSGSIAVQATNIMSYEGTHLEDTLMQAELGGIGSTYSHLDITNNVWNEFPVDVTQIIKNLVAYGVIDNNHKIPLSDPFFVPDRSGNDPRHLNEIPARGFDQISMDTFPTSPGLNSFSQESNYSDYILRVVRHGILIHLSKNTYNITVPGLLFLGNSQQTTVGNKIEIRILRNDPSSDNSSVASDNMIDKKRSGDYLIMAKRMLFNVALKSCQVTMQVGRISNSEVVK